ncbi:MAG: hypothetical protein ABF289_09245 [Clostridiales bacterium]
MLCKCGNVNKKESKYCSECGMSLYKSIKKIPKMITIKEAYENVFKKKLGLSKIYELVKTKSIPHVNANGKILLDVDKTIEWWNMKLENSVKPVKLHGLRKII